MCPLPNPSSPTELPAAKLPVGLRALGLESTVYVVPPACLTLLYTDDSIIGSWCSIGSWLLPVLRTVKVAWLPRPPMAHRRQCLMDSRTERKTAKLKNFLITKSGSHIRHGLVFHPSKDASCISVYKSLRKSRQFEECRPIPRAPQSTCPVATFFEEDCAMAAGPDNLRAMQGSYCACGFLEAIIHWSLILQATASISCPVRRLQPKLWPHCWVLSKLSRELEVNPPRGLYHWSIGNHGSSPLRVPWMNRPDKTWTGLSSAYSVRSIFLQDLGTCRRRNRRLSAVLRSISLLVSSPAWARGLNRELLLCV